MGVYCVYIYMRERESGGVLCIYIYEREKVSERQRHERARDSESVFVFV